MADCATPNCAVEVEEEYGPFCEEHEDEWVVCYTCPTILRFEDTWSPDGADGATCGPCDTEITGRKHG